MGTGVLPTRTTATCPEAPAFTVSKPQPVTGDQQAEEALHQILGILWTLPRAPDVAVKRLPVDAEQIVQCLPRLSVTTADGFANQPTRSARDILGSPDDLKLRSCVTLFARVEPEHRVFQQILDTFYSGRPDSLTLGLLATA